MFHRLAECTPAEWTVDQLTHGLQTASLAKQDNASAPPG